jgi:hypothetical protein
MKEDLEKEKKAFSKSWAKREKQLELVLLIQLACMVIYTGL